MSQPTEGEFEVAARWSPLVELVGFNPERMTPLEIYTLAGKILDDSILCAARQALASEQGTVILPPCEDVISQMGREEKIALKERISGVVPINSTEAAQ